MRDFEKILPNWRYIGVEQDLPRMRKWTKLFHEGARWDFETFHYEPLGSTTEIKDLYRDVIGSEAVN